MIRVRLTGGLGNQMFQYAAGLTLARQHGVGLQLDLSTLPLDGRPFRLDHFAIEAEVLPIPSTPEVAMTGLPKIVNAVGRRYRMIEDRIEESKPWYSRRIAIQPFFHYSPDFFKIRDSVELQGYWQSASYFKPVQDLVRSHFALGRREAESEFIDQISSPNSIGLHVRRGDYVSNPVFAEKYRVMDVDYYSRALARMTETVSDGRVFVFSDDLPWCRENLGSIGDLQFVDGGSDIGDFQLFSLCHHHVISNSTFAWWAAWLGGKPSQMVTAPKEWFFNDYNLKDLLPAEWMAL